MSYIVVEKNGNRKSYVTTSTADQPRLGVGQGYIPLVTGGHASPKIKVSAYGMNLEAGEYQTTSVRSTTTVRVQSYYGNAGTRTTTTAYYNSSVAYANAVYNGVMSNTTALTRASDYATTRSSPYNITSSSSTTMIANETSYQSTSAVQCLELNKTSHDWDGLINVSTQLIAGTVYTGYIVSYHEQGCTWDCFQAPHTGYKSAIYVDANYTATRNGDNQVFSYNWSESSGERSISAVGIGVNLSEHNTYNRTAAGNMGHGLGLMYSSYVYNNTWWDQDMRESYTEYEALQTADYNSIGTGYITVISGTVTFTRYFSRKWTKVGTTTVTTPYGQQSQNVYGYVYYASQYTKTVTNAYNTTSSQVSNYNTTRVSTSGYSGRSSSTNTQSSTQSRSSFYTSQGNVASTSSSTYTAYTTVSQSIQITVSSVSLTSGNGYKVIGGAIVIDQGGYETYTLTTFTSSSIQTTENRLSIYDTTLTTTVYLSRSSSCSSSYGAQISSYATTSATTTVSSTTFA